MQVSTEQQILTFILQAIILSFVIVPLAFIRYKLAGRGIADKEKRKKIGLNVLKYRFLAGFCMGCFDHFWMIVTGFHPGEFFVPWAYWYVTVTYTAIMLFMPSNIKENWQGFFILAWLSMIIPVSSILEINMHYFFAGRLIYPTGWTIGTTFIFYFDVYFFGTIIGTHHWRDDFINSL